VCHKLLPYLPNGEGWGWASPQVVPLRGKLEDTEGLHDSVEISYQGCLGDRILDQIPFNGDDEVKAPEAHGCSKGLFYVAAGHLEPEKDGENTQRPYLVRLLSLFP
jgi:hypothetical protein